MNIQTMTKPSSSRSCVVAIMIIVILFTAVSMFASDRFASYVPVQFGEIRQFVIQETNYTVTTHSVTKAKEKALPTITSHSVPSPSPILFTNDMPSIVGTNITTTEILQNFARCVSVTVAKNKACKQVHANSDLYWRSRKTSGFSFKDDRIRIDLATKCGAFNHTELMAPAPSTKLFPWEKEYLSQGPLTDMKDTAWASKSSIELVGDVKKTRYVGDDVKFIVRLNDGRGNPRKKGGDSVRVWLVNKDNGAMVTANVKDNKDGTYLATTKLPWVGKAMVKATIAHTRELFRAVLYVQRLFSTSHWFSGVFKNAKANEATPCSPFPYLPGYKAPSELCNITDGNGGMPWYCGKPVKKDLSCNDHAMAIKITGVSFLPLGPVDETLIKLTESKRPFLIPTKLVLTAEKKQGSKSNQSTIPIPSLECRHRDLRSTFDEPMSTGYFYNNKWRPFACKLPKVDSEFSQNCLKNTTLILIGDSNTRVQMYQLSDITKCTNKIHKNKVKWHAPLLCEIDNTGLSIQYFPHKLPFFGSMNEALTEKMLTSAVQKMDSIPSTGRYIFHLHFFLHFMPFHLSAAESRLFATRAAVARLMKRNPTAYVVIQSPHSAYDHSSVNKHKLNIFLFEMTKSILKGLGKRVMFLNTINLTMANENADGHPHIPDQFMNLYLGHICGRW